MERFESGEKHAGIIGLSHFHEDDIKSIPLNEYQHNIMTLKNGKRIVAQDHMGGACYVFPRNLYKRFGGATVGNNPKGGWTETQWRFAKNGYWIAYVYPWVLCQHLDDARYPQCLHKNKDLPKEKKEANFKWEANKTKKLITMKTPAERFIVG